MMPGIRMKPVQCSNKKLKHQNNIINNILDFLLNIVTLKYLAVVCCWLYS